MILDCWENKCCYENLHPLFKEAFHFIEKTKQTGIVPGTYEIIGSDLFAKTQRYETRQFGDFEAHNSYIDIQYLVTGTERVYWCPRSQFETLPEYIEADDVMFFEEDNEKSIEITLNAGDFVIFFPQDAHKPSMVADEACEAEKIVLKVRI